MAQLCPALRNSMDYTTHGILQARILEWVVFPFSRDLPNPGIKPRFPTKSIHLQCRRPWFDSWVKKICWRRDRLATPVFLDFPCGSAGKQPACNAGDLCSIPGLGKSPGEGKGFPLQYSDLENSMDYTESDKTV